MKEEFRDEINKEEFTKTIHKVCTVKRKKREASEERQKFIKYKGWS